MFRRQVKSIDELLNRTLRQEGLETPLLQKRIVDAWPKVAGDLIARYTGDRFIRNQVLFIKVLNPALRADLAMQSSKYISALNATVGSMVITDIRFY